MKPAWSPAIVMYCMTTALSPAQPVAKVESTVDVPGARLVVSSWGAGEPVVALPGRGLDTNWFGAVAPRIAASG